MIAGQPLRYLIGKNNDAGEDGCATEPGYDTARLPERGTGIGYANRRQEQPGRLPGVDYIDPPDDIEVEYGEPAPTYGTEFFWANIDRQCQWLKRLGFKIIEIDNIDVDTTEQALELFDHVLSVHDLRVMAKNPWEHRLLAHPGVVGVIQEQGSATARSLDLMRAAANRPTLPIRVVTYGDQLPWAERMANDARKMIDFGVTYSSVGEYQSVTHLLRPNTSGGTAMKIVISSGHAEEVRGASGYLDEVDEARRVVEQVATVMRGLGATVTTFHDDVSVSQNENLNRIVDFHNSKTRDWDVSVHFNAYNTTSKPMGSEVLYVSSTGQAMADTVVDAICEASGLINRGPKKRTDLFFLNNTEEPAILIETCFVDSKADADIYKAQFNNICDAIAGAMLGEDVGTDPGPPETDYEILTAAQVADIKVLAEDSELVDYDWRDRGVAPIGYIQGMAVHYAQCILKLAANDSAVLAMSEPIGSHPKDALQWYGVNATGRANVLRELFVLLYGLGMRESSGNYTEGRDMSADNVSADTAEAGLFQQSWNSSNADDEMKKLLPAYEDSNQPCWAGPFSADITHKNTDSYGSGDGYDFQELAKSCPAFAVEMCGVGLRVLYNHWGPIDRREAEMRDEARALLLDVENYLSASPPDVTDDDVAAAKAKCMASIEAAIDQLIDDLT